MTTFWEKYKLRVYRNCIGDYTRSDGLDYWRNTLFANIITYLLPLGLIVLIPSAVIVYVLGIYSLAIAYIVFGIAITLITLYSTLGITNRKYLFLLLIYTVAAFLIYFMDIYGAGLTYLFGVTVFALLILPTKAGIMTVYINIVICIIEAFLIHYQIVDYSLRDSYQVASWLSISANSILLSIVAVIFMPMLFRGLQETIESQKILKENLLIHRDELEASLGEKDTLLAEIHHRVKNNLAVVSGMLQIQAYKEPDEHVQKKLLDSTLRIKSMASIHEQLYQSHSFSNMSFDTGLRNLVKTILETMDDGSNIDSEFHLEPVQLNINQAVPCSLIVNEVITNSIKHAFKNSEKGLIEIRLHKQDQMLHLKITDNGVGFLKDVKKVKQNSLGMELIQTLALQLEADYQYRSRDKKSGAVFEIEFELSDLPGSSGT